MVPLSAPLSKPVASIEKAHPRRSEGPRSQSFRKVAAEGPKAGAQRLLLSASMPFSKSRGPEGNAPMGRSVQGPVKADGRCVLVFARADKRPRIGVLDRILRRNFLRQRHDRLGKNDFFRNIRNGEKVDRRLRQVATTAICPPARSAGNGGGGQRKRQNETDRKTRFHRPNGRWCPNNSA